MKSSRTARQLLLGLSALSGICVWSSGPPAVAAVEYVRVCSLYGANFEYSPGTDNCANTSPLEYQRATPWEGTASNYLYGGSGNVGYGTNGYATGGGSSAFGTGAYAGGNPNGVIVIPPPVTLDPTNPNYDAAYVDFYENDTVNGVVNRSLYPGSLYPYSNFQNSGATAVGQGAQAGAGASGQNNATAVGQATMANANNATAVGQGAQANAANATAIGQGAQANAANSVAIGQGSVATEANTVSFGTPGTERRLTNVAAGVMGTDAVNVAQLEAAVGAVGATGANTSGLGGPSATGAGAYAGGYGAVASAAGAVALGQGAQATGDPTTAVGNNAIASGNNASAFGAAAVASGDNSLALGAGASATAANSTAIGKGASVQAANSVALGANSTATRGAQSGYTAYGVSGTVSSAGEVSVGSPGGERQITNVAPGNAPTDAVNVAQLQGAVSQVRQRADSGTAAAMAIAGLTQALDPGKTMITGGVGTWRDQTALAFGMSHRFDNAWTFKAGGSFSTTGGSGMNASVGYEF